MGFIEGDRLAEITAISARAPFGIEGGPVRLSSMNKLPWFTSGAALPSLAVAVYLGELSWRAAVGWWLMSLAASVIYFILNWMRMRDRDERFARRPAAVRRDLLKLYELDAKR